MAWPTSRNPKTGHVTARLSPDENADLDAAAQVAGMSRSAYLRSALRRCVAADKRKAEKLAGKDTA